MDSSTSSEEFFGALAIRLNVSCPRCDDPPLSSTVVVIDRYNALDPDGKQVYPKVQCEKCRFVGVVPESWLEERRV